MDVGFWIMNVLFSAPWLYALFLCFKFLWDDSFQESKRGNGPSPASYTPQAGDGGAGAGQRGNGGAGQLWTFYGTGQSCRCSEHCLELSCDHGRMKFIKCYVCGSDWLIPAVKQNLLKDIKIAPILTKVERW
jgi:hypothetical protein|nr:MAG TPA_asm: hypothetical protein [Caudoviricetes sp.]